MQEFFKTKYHEVLEANPELQELEEGGDKTDKASSVAPSAAGAETPQPSGTRIKLNVSSGAKADADAAAQSDEE